MVLAGAQTAEPLRQAAELFDRLWANRGDGTYTAEYAAYRDDSLWKGLRYRFMEWSGLSSF